jgi:tight adherence protein B
MAPDPDTLVIWLTTLVTALIGLVLVARPAGPARKAVARRIERIRLASLEAAAPTRTAARLARRHRGARFGTIAAALQRLMPSSDSLRERLEQAGLRLAPGDALLLGAVGSLLLAILFWAAGLPLAAAAPAGFSLAFGGGALLVAQRRRQRAARFLTLLPEAIDLVVRAVKSGLPVSEAIALIGEEIDDPVGEVFREVASNMRIGMSVEEALWTATRRVDLPEFRFLVVSVTLQRETGGNLAGILANLGTMVRRREQMKLKVRALSSEARAAAMIIGSLPFLVGVVIFFINPDYVMKLFVDPRGQMLALAGLTSMSVGISVIARLVKFDI